MSRGMFITLEGSEGVGKSTNLKFIEDFLRQNGKPLVVTREPGGTPLGERIRSLLLENTSTPISGITELLLMFAVRAHHLDHVIVPSIESGHWVLCDRFTDASYAYQGGGRQIEAQKIHTLQQWIQGQLQPDLTLLLDAPCRIGIGRALERSQPDRFEKEKLDFFERVREVYLSLASRFPNRIKIVDASCSLESVQSDIVRHLQNFMRS